MNVLLPVLGARVTHQVTVFKLDLQKTNDQSISMFKFPLTLSVLCEHTCWFSLCHQFATQVSLEGRAELDPDLPQMRSITFQESLLLYFSQRKVTTSLIFVVCTLGEHVCSNQSSLKHLKLPPGRFSQFRHLVQKLQDTDHLMNHGTPNESWNSDVLCEVSVCQPAQAEQPLCSGWLIEHRQVQKNMISIRVLNIRAHLQH